MTEFFESMTSLWQYLTKGGLTMIWLFLSSILALTVFILKSRQLRRRKIIKPEIVNIIDSIEGPDEINLAIRVCREKEGSFANVMLAGLQNRDLPREELKEAMTDQGRQEVRMLERGLVVLETVAAVAPLLGLLGTVLGMIDVFNKLAISETVQTTQLSDGISKALITTVVGLIIGIPSLVGYNYLVDKAEELVLEIEKFASVLIKKLSRFRILETQNEDSNRGNS